MELSMSEQPRGNRLPPLSEISPKRNYPSKKNIEFSSNITETDIPTNQLDASSTDHELTADKHATGRSSCEREQNSNPDANHFKSIQNALSKGESYNTQDTALDASNSKTDQEKPATNQLSRNGAKVDYKEYAAKLAMKYTLPTSPVKKETMLPDFVFVYDECKLTVEQGRIQQLFEHTISKENISISRRKIWKNTFVELHCSFERLCIEAEKVVLQMPLSGSVSLTRNGERKWLERRMEAEEDDGCISIPFSNAMKGIFENIDDHKEFFRPAIRSLLVHHILQTLDFAWTSDVNIEDDAEMTETLNTMLHQGVYRDAFVLHERSALDVTYALKETVPSADACKQPFVKDRRKELNQTWLTWWKYQPLKRIRNYYGEKIALYFAWLGMLVTSLWIPTFVGIIVTLCGLIAGAQESGNKSAVDRFKAMSRKAVDNDLTPYFAFFICLWGTVFLELWKRKNAEWAYKWDVDDFELQEPDRPQFYGTETRRDPITGRLEQHYPPMYTVLKSMGSFSLVIFMVMLVIASVIAVIAFRIISRVDWFPPANGEMLASLLSTILNSISILVMDKLYKHIAVRLTDWENHRTETQYEDALILKLFGFQFVNSYSSLYYIAFFRERTADGLFQKGSKYTDDCGASNDCLSLLSLQVGVLMIMKPMPKLYIDIIQPWLKRCWRRCWKRVHANKVTSNSIDPFHENIDSAVEYEDFLEMERKKPPLNDFTLSEYTEKVLQYGYLMIFAAAFPLAPLIALITNIVDMRVDAKRLLWLNRRPLAERAQDIGMWYTILELLNFVGVITNAFLVGVTSDFGRNYSNTTIAILPSNSTITEYVSVTTYRNLWVVIIFQNAVFSIKFLVSYAIPDTPEHVQLATKKERHEVDVLLRRAGLRRGPRKSIAPASSMLHANYSSFNMNVITPDNQPKGPAKSSNSSFVSSKQHWSTINATEPPDEHHRSVAIARDNSIDDDETATYSTTPD